MMHPYSADKILHHLHVVEDFRAGRQPMPVHVEIVISDLCNQDCGFCAYRMSGYTVNELFKVIDPITGKENHNPNRMIPWEKIQEIIADCQEMGVKAIQITGGGEPTVHPKCRETVDEILANGIQVGLVTNCLRWSDALTQSMMPASWMRVSIDAGCAETYASIRRTNASNFSKVVSNIENICALRDRTGSRLHVGVGFVITKENWSEVAVAARIARNAGVNSFRISAMLQSEGDSYFADFIRSAAEEARNACALSTPSFIVVNNLGDRVQDLAQGSPDYTTCYFQHVTTFIGGDMNVYRCCNQAYNDRGMIGSVASQRFIDLWGSEQKRKAFDDFDAHGCDRCQFNRKNKSIASIVESNIEHANFV